MSHPANYRDPIEMEDGVPLCATSLKRQTAKESAKGSSSFQRSALQNLAVLLDTSFVTTLLTAN